MNERQELERAIRTIEAQRAVLGDALVEASLLPLRTRLAATLPRSGPSDGTTLKQITVLFLDVVESTSMSHFLDTEDTQVVINDALEHFRSIVERFKGRVMGYAGDSLFVAFGVDEASEDDAERAVRAALALLESARSIGESVADQYGYDRFAARVGVHTGSVLLDTTEGRRATVHGVTVNIASRMEQSAPPGRVRISDDTFRHVRGIFDVEPQPPLTVKGIDHPMTTHLIIRAKPRAFRVTTRGIEGVETRMIGRDAELTEMQAAFRRLHGSPGFSLVTIVAEAGLGKSRLLYEFENWADAQPEDSLLFRGRADPQMPGKPYGLLRDILMWRFELRDTDPMEVAKEAFEARVTPLLASQRDDAPVQALVHSLGQLIGFDYADSPHVGGRSDDSQRVRSRGFHAAAALMRTMTRDRTVPIVMLLDDMHWADAASLDFLSYLADVNRDVPILLLAFARPELFENELSWPAAPGSARIDLDRLDQPLSRMLVEELLKKFESIPSALREAVIGGAEGNPFYMEELIKMLIDEGAIRTSEPVWQVEADTLLALKLPASLTGVLQARLDGLPVREKRALQHASIIGMNFSDDALRAIDEIDSEALESLVRRKLIHRGDTARRLDGHEFVFSHQLLQSTVYATVPKPGRRDVHAKLARWLVGRIDAGGTASIGLAAEHFEKAGEPILACRRYADAALQAQQIYAHDAALNYTSRALDLGIGDDDQESRSLKWRLYDIRERTLDVLGRRAEQMSDIEVLVSLADAQDDDAHRAEAAWRQCDYAYRVSNFAVMEAEARRAITLSRRGGHIELRLRSEQRLAISLKRLGQVDNARKVAIDGFAEAQRRGLRLIENRFLTAMLLIDASGSNVEARLADMRKAAALNREIGNVRDLARNHINICAQLLAFGEYKEARFNAGTALELLATIGDLPTRPYALNNLATISCHDGDFTAAKLQAKSALDIAVKVGESYVEIWSHCCLADAYLAAGEHDQARASFCKAYALGSAGGDVQRFDAASGMARVALSIGDFRAALAAIEPILAYLSSNETLEGTETPHRIRLTCWRALSGTSDPRAVSILEDAYRVVQSQAAAITNDRVRHGFLHHVDDVREIVLAWREHALT